MLRAYFWVLEWVSTLESPQATGAARAAVAEMRRDLKSIVSVSVVVVVVVVEVDVFDCTDEEENWSCLCILFRSDRDQIITGIKHWTFHK